MILDPVATQFRCDFLCTSVGVWVGFCPCLQSCMVVIASSRLKVAAGAHSELHVVSVSQPLSVCCSCLRMFVATCVASVHSDQSGLAYVYLVLLCLLCPLSAR